MSDLRTFQATFGGWLADPARSGREGELARALTVHRNTSSKAAQDALAANYPHVRALMGEAAFAACAAAHAAAAPPREARLNAFGAGFPGFLADYGPAAELPYLADVAALERLCTEALFSADAPALEGGQAPLDPVAVLRLHPATRFAAFATPAVAIWLAHDAGDDDALAALDWRPQAALVTRPRAAVRVTPLAPGGVPFLEACAEGAPLAAAAAAAVAAGADLASLFSNLIQAGAFA